MARNAVFGVLSLVTVSDCLSDTPPLSAVFVEATVEDKITIRQERHRPLFGIVKRSRIGVKCQAGV